MDHDGGYAEFMVAFEDFVYPIPAGIPSQQAAPLLCAGAVGYRSLAMADVTPGSSLGLTGFGSSGRLVLQMAKALYPNLCVYVFARNPDERQLALRLGADWAGNTTDPAPTLCEAVIDTTPAWRPVLEALRQLAPGGRLIINAIRKESGDRHLLSELDYGEQLWMEKSIRSVANVTRQDVRAMLELAANHQFIIEVEEFALEDAERALLAISTGHVQKSAVLNLRHGE
jgi:propanol-preferring alcohol dehydrogenase